MHECCKEKEKNNEQKEEKIRISTNSLVAVFLAIVFVVGAFQTLQLTELSKTITEQQTAISNLKATGLAVTTGAVSANALGPPSDSQVPSNLQNLPDMVGGC